MFVYNSGSYGRATLFVSPGAHHPENSNWVDSRTKAPIQFTVKFERGKAEVDEEMGRYLIDHQLAKRSPVWVPPQLTPEELHRPVYAKPIEVGRPLSEIVAGV